MEGISDCTICLKSVCDIFSCKVLLKLSWTSNVKDTTAVETGGSKNHRRG